MKGQTHFTIGLAVGAIAGFQATADPLTILTCAGIGAIAGIAPDLDTNGMASNRITISRKASRNLLQSAGLVLLFLAVYQYFQATDPTIPAYFAASGIVSLMAARFLSQRRKLTITGALVIALGLFVAHSTAILLAGIYIAAASFLPHRSYTHSLLGLAYFFIMINQFQQEWPLDGMVAAGTLGYASHLISDMKILPANRRGVKWFLPVWKREF